MMNQTNSTRRLNWQYFLVLPVTILLFSSFSLKIENLNIGKEISEILPLTAVVSEMILEKIPHIKNLPDLKKEKNDLAQMNKNEMPVVQPVTTMMNNEVQTKRYAGSIKLSQNPIEALPKMLPSIEHQDTTRIIRGQIISKDGVAMAGVNVILKGTSIGTVTDKEGTFTMLVGDSYNELVIASPDNLVQVIDISKDDNFIITLAPDMHVASFPTNNEKEVLILPKGGLSVSYENRPLFILDEKELSQEEIMQIDPNNIKEITVLKGDGATKLYGDKGINGVVIIELKKESKKKKG